MTSDDWSMTIDGVTVRVARLGGGRRGPIRLHLPQRTWRRAAAIVDRLGVEEALVELDARAYRVLDRGLVAAACRWRDVMAAIHAMSGDERSDGDADH